MAFRGYSHSSSLNALVALWPWYSSNSFHLLRSDWPTVFTASVISTPSAIAARVSDLLVKASERIERSGVAHLAADRIVVTGGGSQLKGLAGFAEELLGRPVRIGRPDPAEGMPAAYCSPIFSTAMGLIPIALDPAAGLRAHRVRTEVAAGGYLKRVGQWLRDGF